MGTRPNSEGFSYLDLHSFIMVAVIEACSIQTRAGNSAFVCACAEEGMKRRLGKASTYNSVRAKTMNGQSGKRLFNLSFILSAWRLSQRLSSTRNIQYWSRHIIHTRRRAAPGHSLGEAFSC